MSTALVKYTPIRRDTPAEYPCPPLDDVDNPPVPIHPYLYNLDCPISWDVRMNLRNNARRIASDERLSTIALKANAISAAGMNHNLMKIMISDELFPWTITIKREAGLKVGDILMDIGVSLNIEVTDSERWIADPERVQRAEASREANQGTGAVRIRPAKDVMRRVDWLGNKTKFAGLVHSSAKEYQSLVRRRVHSQDRSNAWVMIVEERD